MSKAFFSFLFIATALNVPVLSAPVTECIRYGYHLTGDPVNTKDVVIPAISAIPKCESDGAGGHPITAGTGTNVCLETCIVPGTSTGCTNIYKKGVNVEGGCANIFLDPEDTLDEVECKTGNHCNIKATAGHKTKDKTKKASGICSKFVSSANGPPWHHARCIFVDHSVNRMRTM